MDKSNGNKKGEGDRDRGKGNNKKKPYIKNHRKRWTIKKYCWTHGACNHNSDECELMAPGHKKEATFRNKIGGNVVFCKFVGENNKK